MHGHESELLTTTFLMLSAVSFGLILRWLKQPPLVGYILAGLALGPAGLGLVDYSDEISSLAEFGVILLLFIIGIELSVKAFLRVLQPAVVATLGQIACCILLAISVKSYFGWTLPQILLIGFVLTLSSTAVALMVLQGLGQLRTHAGQLTVGVLVAQDIAVAPMLVFAQSGADVFQQWPLLLVRIVIALLVLAGLLVWIGKTARQRLPLATLLEGNVELAILFSLGACMLAASLTGTMGLSPVFGAFCAGLALSHTNLRKAVLDAILPLQSLLLVVFFVSIGLLVDLDYVKSHWGVIAAVTLGVLFIKTLFGWALLSLGGEPVGRALVSSLVTPQIGEFSFVLTTSGVASGIFTGFEADFLLAVIAASLFISPIWSGVLHYLVVRYRIHDPDPQPSVVPDNE
ncbi:MAG: cation:proton antiporter [Candidatus Puniceispirillaceae bacterium]|jgi:CPA2 family monovalent cation:H+ antiporter-2